jgi:putative SOS response-associated peptidase YedK
MCSNYRPVTRLDRLLTFFGVERAKDEPPPDLDVYPMGLAPFIRLDPDHDPADGAAPLVVQNGLYGLLPQSAVELNWGRKTYNARCETVHRLLSFKEAWAKGWRCIIPAEVIYEPCYESGRFERWRIGQAGDVPLGIAGIYRLWTNPQGAQNFTFAMITVNADQHPLYRRLHKPGEEKRMPVILDPEDYGDWLRCPVSEAARFFKPWGGLLEGEPSPPPPRVPAPRAPKAPPPVDPNDTPDLFG